MTLKNIMKKIFLLILIFSIPLVSSAQYKGLNSKKRKSSNSFLKKKGRPQPEFIIGLGAANFLGELGGANQVGTNFVKDLEFSMTRPSAAFGMRYKFHQRFAVKGGFYYQFVSGHDKLTKEPFRNNRNLHFRSSIYELSAQFEFFLTKEPVGKRYKIKNAKGSKNLNIQVYMFLGVGGFYYNPKAKYSGEWQELYDLHTEGQGLPDGPKQYKRVSFCIPYGIGAKTKISNDFSIGLEVGIRKTFTDYIDDVSGVYYDNAKIVGAYGQIAGQAADPSLLNLPPEYGGTGQGYQQGQGWQGAPGEQRGDAKDKDAYMFLNVTLSYKIPKKRKTRSKF